MISKPPTPQGQPIILHVAEADPDAPLPPYEPNMIPKRILPADFPFPIAEPRPEPVMVTRPCGCTSMVTEPGSKPLQVSWCVPHDPGYEPPTPTPEGSTQ